MNLFTLFPPPLVLVGVTEFLGVTSRSRSVGSDRDIDCQMAQLCGILDPTIPSFFDLNFLCCGHILQYII